MEEEAAALAEHILRMRGTWISPAKREKVVAAKGLPEGWSVVAGLRKDQGRYFLAFRDFRSPDGTSWPTFEAASKYVIANLELGEKIRELRSLEAVEGGGAFECVTCRKKFMESRQCIGHMSWHSKKRKRNCVD
ncbi:hypothetical protein SELMODRAFT_428084 [Selaginella moellendorffii]|uniref:C2H2-type domain-containing protein n=1 Tax=Selaginella moellendorffii TaxID=88036 RepID=D8T1N9_SELML|nr:uncharacterized protein LOC9636662 [Selaginella moellendorffii]EFJ09420.1 hypothetical protein SELMODRAFT_428084 [Selaginella moellendorffii]|eukprot:XP_002989544.1 uncharacterized protein LOC9636662 [Selaginella moellendorffii]